MHLQFPHYAPGGEQEHEIVGTEHEDASKHFSVISVHFTSECNLACPMCYRSRETPQEQKPWDFFFELVPYVSTLTQQIALGGGEPFLYPEFVRDFSSECARHEIVCNVTTNATLLPPQEALENITMASLSFDRYKIPGMREMRRYFKALHHFKDSGVQVGCNLLVDGEMLEEKVFDKLVSLLFAEGIDRVFALYPKNWETPHILRHRHVYGALSMIYPHFYVDDLTWQILSEGKYENWEKPCHHGRDLISIDECGYISGCSFDMHKAGRLETPKDILRFRDYAFEERYSCPHLKRNQEVKKWS